LQQIFDEATSKDLIEFQHMISDTRSDSDTKTLINPQPTKQCDELFLIDESLREPLLNVANKLLGRQCLNFDQLTPSQQGL
jgi:hypothetical protein